MAENLWLSYAFLAASIYATLSLVDKVILDREAAGPISTTALSGFSMMLTFVAAGLLTGNTGLEATAISTELLITIGIGILGGVTYVLSLWTYFIGLEKSEVSRFIPLLSLDLIIVLVLAFVLLGEGFQPIVYVGVFIIFFGTVLISLDASNLRGGFKSKQALFWGVVVAGTTAALQLILGYMTAHLTLFAIMFWVGVGGIVSLAALLLWKLIQSDAVPTEALKSAATAQGGVLLTRGVFIAIAYYTFVLAIETGPVSIAVAILKLDVFMVFFGALVLSKIAPAVLYEPIDRRILVQKFTASGLIVGGVVIIQSVTA